MGTTAAILTAAGIGAATSAGTAAYQSHRAEKEKDKAVEQQAIEKQRLQEQQNIEASKLEEQNKRIQDNANKMQQSQIGLVNDILDDEDDDYVDNDTPWANNYI